MRPAFNAPEAANFAAAVSGVSWGAIVAGAAAAAALSLILLILGMGLGLSSVSPWAGQGASTSTFGWTTIAWLTFTQPAASGMGGYLAGRLRTRWLSVHTDEVYFRDTAHGFLAWAIATLVTAGLLTSVIGSILGTGAQAFAAMAARTASTVAAGTVATGAAAMKIDLSSKSSGDEAMGYFVDTLFRKAPGSDTGASVSSATGVSPTAASPAGTSPANAAMSSESTGAACSAASSAEVARIFVISLRAGTLLADDARYIGQLVAQRTGMTQAEAEQRATSTFGKLQSKLRETEVAARDAADKARKASAATALWLFVSLLAGAFIASLAAPHGGRRFERMSRRKRRSRKPDFAQQRRRRWLTASKRSISRCLVTVRRATTPPIAT